MGSKINPAYFKTH